MVVSAEDRRKWDRQVAALTEMDNDDEGSLEWRAEMHDWADRQRARSGGPPLKTEGELYRYAETLGLRRSVS